MSDTPPPKVELYHLKQKRMNTEELLKPRYKVIADYPKSIYEVGTIINAGTTSQDLLYCDWEGPRMRDYPHLFKKLEWWEDRKIEDMPEYVKSIYDNRIYKIVLWEHCVFWTCETENGKSLMQDEILPATQQEYEQSLVTNS